MRKTLSPSKKTRPKGRVFKKVILPHYQHLRQFSNANTLLFLRMITHPYHAKKLIRNRMSFYFVLVSYYPLTQHH